MTKSVTVPAKKLTTTIEPVSKPPPAAAVQVKPRTSSVSRPAVAAAASSSQPSPATGVATTPITLKSEAYLIEKIKKERQELIKKGVSLNDPLITEIDRRLKSYRLQSQRRLVGT